VATEFVGSRNILPASRTSSAPSPVTAPRTEGWQQVGNQSRVTCPERSCAPISQPGIRISTTLAGTHRGSEEHEVRISSWRCLARLPEQANPLGDVAVVDIYRINLREAFKPHRPCRRPAPVPLPDHTATQGWIPESSPGVWSARSYQIAAMAGCPFSIKARPSRVQHCIA